MHVVVITGSRDWDDQELLYRKLDERLAEHPDMVIVEGEAKGADVMARSWATSRGVEFEPFPAAWNEHDPAWCPGLWCSTSKKRYCVAAGARRNQQMLDYALAAPTAEIIAFKDGLDPTLTRGGTEDMVSRAKAAELPGRHVFHPER